MEAVDEHLRVMRTISINSERRKCAPFSMIATVQKWLDTEVALAAAQSEQYDTQESFSGYSRLVTRTFMIDFDES